MKNVKKTEEAVQNKEVAANLKNDLQSMHLHRTTNNLNFRTWISARVFKLSNNEVREKNSEYEELKNLKR